MNPLTPEMAWSVVAVCFIFAAPAVTLAVMSRIWNRPGRKRRRQGFKRK